MVSLFNYKLYKLFDEPVIFPDVCWYCRRIYFAVEPTVFPNSDNWGMHL